MADLIIKPSAVADEFKMNDANSSANTILTIEGQTDSTVTTAGRIIYGKGVNETLGTTSYDATPNTQTIDLATGTFFNVEMGALIDDWKILHLPAANTIAAWVVRLKNHSTPVVNLWAATATSTYDTGSAWEADGSHFAVCSPVFNWAGADHILSTGASNVDVIAFWTLGGDDPIIYGTISGQVFA